MATAPNQVPYREPTSALTFGDLLLEVSREAGVAYYGADGDEEAQIPVNKHDLAEMKRHVNNGLLMFFNDAPKTGWRFARPVATVDLWGAVAVGTDTVTAVTDSGVTTVTATAATFSESMVYHMIQVTDLTNDVMITKVLSTTVCEIDLNGESDFSTKTFGIASNGSYTMPPYFAGIANGQPTYVADSNEGVTVSWVDESKIRRYRENITDETGNPYWLAHSLMYTDGLGNRLNSRRFELLAYPKAGADQVVQFPFEFHFDKLVELSDNPPVPFVHDETIKAACLSVIERDVFDKPGRHSEAYNSKSLPQSHILDGRMGPRHLGYFGNPSGGLARDISLWRDLMYDRPDVTGTGFS
jgi:hypothetical protein